LNDFEGDLQLWHLVLVQAIIQAITVAHVCMRFFIRAQIGAWEIVDELEAIRNNYMRGWFAYDVLYAAPIEFFFLGWADNRGFLWLLLRNFLRIPRNLGMHKSGNPLREHRLWYRFISFILLTVLMLHFLATFFSIIEETDYVTALYWSVITCTSVGYGDVRPGRDVGSRFYAMFAQLTGLAGVATMTAFATKFVATKDKLEEQLTSKKQMMDSMLRYYNIPWNVQRQVISMFPQVLEAQSEHEFAKMTESLPKFVAEQIQDFTRSKMLQAVPFFRDLSKECTLDMTRRLEQRFCPVKELVVTAGDIGREMFILVRGVVEVLVPNKNDTNEELVVAVLRNGAFFGEIALVEETTRMASIQAVTLCELLVLGKDDFDDLTSKWRELDIAMRTEVRRRKAESEKIASAAAKQDEEEVAFANSMRKKHHTDLRHKMRAAAELRSDDGDDRGGHEGDGDGGKPDDDDDDASSHTSDYTYEEEEVTEEDEEAESGDEEPAEDAPDTRRATAI